MPPGRFPTTRWTLVFAAREPESTALAELLAAYWRPAWVFLRRRGVGAEAAEDAVQGFFLHLIEKGGLARLDPARGRFRSFLLTALQNHRAHEREKDAALKRGGGQALIPLDVVLAEQDLAAAPETAEAAFDREWALALFERAVERLRGEYAAGVRKGDPETVLRFFRLGGGEPPSYAEAAAQCGLTPAQFKAHLHRARSRFRELVREEVAATVEDEADVDAELQNLLAAL